MRKISILVALALAAAAVTVPAAAQTAPSCNGLPATQVGSFLNGTEEADVLVGTEEADRIFSEGGNDTICALGGDDVVAPGLGDDHVDAGGGDDDLWLTEVADGAGTIVDLAAGTATGPQGSDVLVVGGVENVEMNCGLTTSDTLIGDDDDNILSGGSGADEIRGGGGDDVIYGTDPTYGRTDAICWNGEGDGDELDGGPGNDILWGQAAADSLDGGDGWDILDGGDDIDVCLTGERYWACETEDPAAPPPECSDATDNDGDGDIDGQDSNCSHSGDPSELVRDDPGCNDGIDNDGDGRVDFSADRGCLRLGDETELNDCIDPCPPPSLTIEYRSAREIFRGKLGFFVAACAERRLVLLRKKRPDRDRTIGRDVTSDRRIWKVPRDRPPRGRFYAVARRATVVLQGGEAVDCARARSPIMKIQS